MHDWLEHYSAILTWSGIIAVVMFLGTVIATPWLVSRIPQNYFVNPMKASPHRGSWHWLFWMLRNILGVVFIAIGILMLALPGQGILTIVLGLSLMSFPAKRSVLCWLIRKPLIHRPLNWIRHKTGSAPLDLP